MAVSRLLLRSAILEGESLKGYLMRLALLNGYRNLSWLLRAADVHPAALDRGTASLDGLARMAGRTVPELEAIYWPASVVHRHRASQHRVAHTTIPAWLLNVRHPRVCPRCIREGRPIQRVWEIAWTTCCPRHGNYLVSQCSRCNQPLSWDRPWLHRCHCGFGLPALPIRQAPPAEIALSALFGERFAAKPATGLCQTLPAWLNALPSAELPSFLLKLSALEINAKAPQQLSSMCRDVDAAKAITAWLADLLSTWPASIFIHLDRAMATLSDADNLRGQAVRIREAVRGLARDAPIEVRKTLTAWMRTSCNQSWLQPQGAYSGLSSAESSIQAERLRASLDLGKQAFASAISIIKASPIQPSLVSSDALSPLQLQQLKELVARWRSALSETAAANKLGLSRRDVGSLVRAGLLTPESIPWDGHKFSKRFDERQLDQLVRRIFAMTTRVTTPSLLNLGDLTAVREQFGRRAFVGNLVVGILSGRLKCYRLAYEEPEGLSQIRLDIHEVKTHLHLGLRNRTAKRHYA